MKMTCCNLYDRDELTNSELEIVFWVYFIWASIQDYLENLMAYLVFLVFSKCFFLMPDCIAQKEGYFYSLLDSRWLCSQEIKQRLWLEAVEAFHASNIPPHFQETTVVWQ